MNIEDLPWGVGVPVPLFPWKKSSFSLVPKNQNLDFLCFLFPQIAFVPCSFSFRFFSLVPLKQMALLPCSPKPLGGPKYLDEFNQNDENQRTKKKTKTKKKKKNKKKTRRFHLRPDMETQTLRKHAYSNTLKILPPKIGKFSDKKFWYFSYFCSKHRLWVLVRTASARRF